MSIQFYAQPLLSTGRYRTFKEAAEPRTYRFTRYGIDAGTIAYDAETNLYTVDPTDDGSGRQFAFPDPDFNFKSLRINAVFRWEFRPGSTLYVVWTDQRQHDHPGPMRLGSDLSDLWRAPSDNVVMVKVSYWLSR
jgi:uncharacterized protein YkuJ